MARRMLSLVLCLSFCLQQVGFAQTAIELNFSGHLNQMRSALMPDKFRPVHLRYFSYDSATNNFTLLLDKGDAKELKGQQLEASSKTLLDYFVIGISLPDESFWVNLRPDREDQVIDDELAKTDIGKIMLEADLHLKKDTARFTSPQTPEGREYWNKLYQKAGELFGSENVTIPTITRPWIVPNEIIIREAQGSAYIYKATLKVCLEQDHIKDSPLYNFSDARQKALNEYSSELIRESILPKLTKEVNIAKRYAPLRQTFYSLVLSRWFKARYIGKPGAYAARIDSKDLTDLTSKEAWSKTTYFQQYKKSFEEGEYNIKEPAYTPTGQVIRSYFSGGVLMDMGKTPPNQGQFAGPDAITRIERNPNLVKQVVVSPVKVSGGVDMLDVAASPMSADGQKASSAMQFTDAQKKLVIATVLAMQGHYDMAYSLLDTLISPESLGFRFEPNIVAQYLRYEKEAAGSDASKFLNTIEELMSRIKAQHGSESKIYSDYALGLLFLENNRLALARFASPKTTKSEVLSDGKEITIEYNGPIKITLISGVEFMIYKTSEIPDDFPVKPEVNPACPYVIIRTDGRSMQMMGIWRTKQTVLGRWMAQESDFAGRFGTYLNNIFVSRQHVTVTLKGDTLTIKDGGPDRQSKNGLLVEWGIQPFAHEQANGARGQVLQELEDIKASLNIEGLPHKNIVLRNGKVAHDYLNEIQSALLQNEISADRIDGFKDELQKMRMEIKTISDLFELYGVSDPRKRLGVEANADVNEIKKAYRKLMVKFHSDKYGNGNDPYPISKIVAEEISKLLNDAYSQLVSSPMEGEALSAESSTAELHKGAEVPGGIDFRVMDIKYEPMGIFKGLNFTLPILSKMELSQINIDDELNQIHTLVEQGIMPSGQRMKELVAACSQKGELQTRTNDLILCLIDICRLQEENCCEASAELKETLVILDSENIPEARG